MDKVRVTQHIQSYKQKADSTIAIKKEFFKLWIKILNKMKAKQIEEKDKNDF